jgi:hypothetical protein
MAAHLLDGGPLESVSTTDSRSCLFGECGMSWM